MLEPQIKRFDPRLFAMLQESFQSLPGNAAPGRALQATLPLLVAGCALSENMMFEDGRMALGKRTVLNKALIERLRNVNAINRIRDADHGDTDRLPLKQEARRKPLGRFRVA